MISSARLLTAALGHIQCLSDATTASLLRQCQIMQISSQARTGGVWVTSYMLLKGNTWTTNHCSYNSALEAVWSVRGVIQRVSKRMTRFQIIICNNENVLQLQNILQTIKKVLKFHSP
jgi:hypothetical protein